MSSHSRKIVPKPLDPASRLPKAEVERMFSLIRGSRLPESNIVPGADWDYGIPLTRLKELRDFWLDSWSFDDFLAEISQWEHYTVEIEQNDVHYVHIKSGKEGAIPLLMTHGWPGSFYEFHKVVGPLTSPTSEADPVFHIVLPSLPGYGFSGPPPRKGWTLIDSARVFNTLMVDVLGHKEYVAQGGDWGYCVTRALTANHSDHCRLAHFNILLEFPPPAYQWPFLIALFALPKWVGRRVCGLILSEREMDSLAKQVQFRDSGMGYISIQGSKPATIGYALNDHPVGLLAYIGEKYHSWSDPNKPISDAEIVSTISLYFLTQTFGTSVLPYFETKDAFMRLPKQGKGSKSAVSVFKHDVLGAPRSWVTGKLNIAFYKEHDAGGHFVGFEQPETLVADVREFVKGNWKK